MIYNKKLYYTIKSMNSKHVFTEKLIDYPPLAWLQCGMLLTVQKRRSDTNKNGQRVRMRCRETAVITKTWNTQREGRKNDQETTEMNETSVHSVKCPGGLGLFEVSCSAPFWNGISLCRAGRLQTCSKDFSFCQPSTGIADVHHHTQPWNLKKSKK